MRTAGKDSRSVDLLSEAKGRKLMVRREEILRKLELKLQLIQLTVQDSLELVENLRVINNEGKKKNGAR